MHFYPSLTLLASSFIGLQLFFVYPTAAVNVTSIADCPAIPARESGPADAKDVRIDDIKVIAAMGDSIMAGFGMMGSSSIIDPRAFREYRGQSYGIGGDSDAETMATFTKKFSPDLVGASLGSRSVSLCLTGWCSPTFTYRLTDRLNAAVSASTGKNLDNQLDYLIPEIEDRADDFENDWKLINIQIGSNDQCASCGASASDVTAEKYGQYVSAAVQRIIENVPNVIVNLMGVFRVSPVYTLTEGQSYCTSFGDEPLNRQLCSCFQGSDQDRADMDALSDAYNEKLIEIYESYKNKDSTSYAVTYQPNNINIADFPIEAMSNADCFHPSLMSHQWIAKTHWNNLFIPQGYKPDVHSFDENMEIYCPTETDRIMIN
ncbi:hypothetical protein BDB00DRAFT_869786 [Zychaea mexicana]|uniref:uncharacterized protein n=1 Tax=Zychaea mexicana TaxID=64656 RepID=UPI0022FF1E59|nr:uncharacterized protein BDB00DRAFT_869786 [Zychaea mexicana]KAI9496152.1 hypothetical protein BDB00DRAFT_869786 [Zychaea mexicana]